MRISSQQHRETQAARTEQQSMKETKLCNDQIHNYSRVSLALWPLGHRRKTEKHVPPMETAAHQTTTAQQAPACTRKSKASKTKKNRHSLRRALDASHDRTDGLPRRSPEIAKGRCAPCESAGVNHSAAPLRRSQPWAAQRRDPWDHGSLLTSCVSGSRGGWQSGPSDCQSLPGISSYTADH